MTASTIWCCELELSGDAGPVAVVAPSDEPRLRALVRLHGETIGYVTVPRTGGPADVRAIVAAAWQEFPEPLAQHLAAEGLSVPAPGERAPAALENCPAAVVADQTVSVVVCTRNRSDSLGACFDRLAAVRYPHVEIVIVDNAPDDSSTRDVVAKYGFTYVCEPRPGLSAARNAGLAAATGTFVAYTDDDVSVDERWIDGLLRGFQRRADVVCVTGLVCTASITNGAEAYFDARVSSWSTRCRPELFDMSTGRGALYPFSAGIFGTGASFAFDRARLIELGGFDEALGAGTATRGGEDLDIFVRVLLAGGAIAYSPDAVVWHHHRADDASLLRQMYGYGSGLTAYLTKLLAQRGTRGQILRRLPAGAAKMARIRRDTNKRLTGAVPPPPGALRREFAGFLAGPALYARSRRSGARR